MAASCKAQYGTICRCVLLQAALVPVTNGQVLSYQCQNIIVCQTYDLREPFDTCRCDKSNCVILCMTAGAPAGIHLDTAHQHCHACALHEGRAPQRRMNVSTSHLSCYGAYCRCTRWCQQPQPHSTMWWSFTLATSCPACLACLRPSPLWQPSACATAWSSRAAALCRSPLRAPRSRPQVGPLWDGLVQCTVVKRDDKEAGLQRKLYSAEWALCLAARGVGHAEPHV